jgi:hypothetical protein
MEVSNFVPLALEIKKKKYLTGVLACRIFNKEYKYGF